MYTSQSQCVEQYGTSMSVARRCDIGWKEKEGEGRRGRGTTRRIRCTVARVMGGTYSTLFN